MTKTRDLESPSPPTCCTQYPGSIVLECRLDGNQPVAHVVHTPSTTSPSPAMCLLVKTRYSEKGSFARVAARPERNVTTTPQSQLSYHLESHTGPKGAVPAVAVAVGSAAYFDTSSAMSGPPVTLLETTKSQGPISRVLYHPTAEIESCSLKVSTHIECTATPKGPFAKVTQSASDKEAVNHPAVSSTCFETVVKYDGSYPIASHVTEKLSSKNGSSFENENEILETRIVDGPATMIDQHMKLDQVIDTIQRSNVQKYVRGKIPGSLKIKEKIESDASKMYSSFPTRSKLHNSEESNLEKKFLKPAALSRRNGLDPNLAEMRGKEGKWKYFKPIKTVQKPQDSSDRFQKIEKLDTDFPTKLDRSRKQKMQKIEKSSNEGIKRKANGSNFEEIPLPSPEELISNYREYLSEAQLKKYQYCSSRRNGLQDECYLSVPRAVVQLKREEMTNGNQESTSGSRDLSK